MRVWVWVCGGRQRIVPNTNCDCIWDGCWLWTVTTIAAADDANYSHTRCPPYKVIARSSLIFYELIFVSLFAHFLSLQRRFHIFIAVNPQVGSEFASKILLQHYMREHRKLLFSVLFSTKWDVIYLKRKIITESFIRERMRSCAHIQLTILHFDIANFNCWGTWARRTEWMVVKRTLTAHTHTHSHMTIRFDKR